MSGMINFAIDLGTTNSLVAMFHKGTVEVFKDPRHQGIEILPSVVGFRHDRILVGQQAKTFAERDCKNVVSRFKRKIGTTESFKIEVLGQSKTPIELSAFVLKELKTFIHTGEVPEAVVITIPASFDMVQCNATEEAGYAAGFKQVVLLQEPIAASLAYANKGTEADLMNSQWIVYDLGGGTFDVALVRIIEGELKIVDHEGNNYLGGTDFDALIVEKIIVPYLEKRGKFTDLLPQMKDARGKYNQLWYSLLLRAEEAKIALSTQSSAEIDLSPSNIKDENRTVIDDNIKITRSEYESLIKDAVDDTSEMLRKILTRNSLRPQDLKFVLMVGGSTYTPFVRKRIEELLGIPVNTGIDPTNAIAIGAAYFAGTKKINLGQKSLEKLDQLDMLKVKFSYNPTSKELEEMFQAKINGDVAGFFYRITSADGSYDSGLKKLTPRISEDLPLQEDAYNLFAFRIYDGQNNPVSTDADSIQIAQGKYSVAGQMLPEDLSLVKDKPNTNDTILDLVFPRNSVLPSRAKKIVQVSKAVKKCSSNEIRIIVVQGSSENHSSVNKTIGCLVISGKSLERDLPRGTEIDLAFELSESRDLTVQAYVNPSGPEFLQVFSPTYRKVPVDVLNEEVRMLGSHLEKERAEALSNENYEVLEKLDELHGPVGELHDKAMILTLNDVTDDRYKLQDTKRKIAQEIYKLTAGKRLERLRADYHTVKEEVTEVVKESGNDLERRQLHEIVVREHTFLNSTNPQKLEAEIDQLHHISFQILRRTPAFLTAWFHHLVERRETFNDQLQANHLIEAGKKHLQIQAWDRLAEVNVRLHSLLPEEEKDSEEMEPFTRII